MSQLSSSSAITANTVDVSFSNDSPAPYDTSLRRTTPFTVKSTKEENVTAIVVSPPEMPVPRKKLSPSVVSKRQIPAALSHVGDDTDATVKDAPLSPANTTVSIVPIVVSIGLLV